MKKRLLTLFLLFASVGWATAGFVDLYNGVRVGSTLPAHDLQFISPEPAGTAKLTLVDFWATWCAPCRESIPQFNALHEKFGSRGVRIIGVSQESKEVVRPFLARFPMHYPHAVEGQMSLHKALGIKALPYAVFVDSAGTIVWRGQPSDIDEALVESLLKAHGG